jgi:hypothetical protein
MSGSSSPRKSGGSDSPPPAPSAVISSPGTPGKFSSTFYQFQPQHQSIPSNNSSNINSPIASSNTGSNYGSSSPGKPGSSLIDLHLQQQRRLLRDGDYNHCDIEDTESDCNDDNPGSSHGSSYNNEYNKYMDNYRDNYFDSDIYNVKRYVSPVVYAVATSIILASVVLVFSANTAVFAKHDSGSISYDTDADTDISSVSGSFFVVSNDDYGVFDSSVNAYPFLQATDTQLMEPYKRSILSINTGDTFGDASGDCSYSLSAMDSDSTKVTDYVDIHDNASDDDSVVSWHIVAKFAGNFNIKVTQTCDGATTAERVGNVWVKYVRRELSALTDSDRDDFLDALYTLYTVNTVDGKKLYGDNYVSAAYLATIHVDASSNPVCDEFHPLSGFLNAHLYLSLFLEQSLQAVDPSVSLPLLEQGPLYSSDDYIQTHMGNQLDGGAWNKYFVDDYFGSNDPVTGMTRLISTDFLVLLCTYVCLCALQAKLQTVGSPTWQYQ